MVKKQKKPRPNTRNNRNASPAPKRPSARTAIPVVGVGASAGGLEAFTQFLKALPGDTNMAFVLVQHLDPAHESQLAQILSKVTPLPLQEVANDQPVKPNHVYIMPRNRDLSIAQGVLKLHPRPRNRTPHHPIDFFFESLAQDQCQRAIGIVLSGTASDGTLGLEAIKAEGGITFAQDDSAAHDGMPQSAIAAGVVDLVLAPADIARELARISRHPHGAGQALELGRRGGALETVDDEKRAGAGALKGSRAGTGSGYQKVMFLLRSHSGVDFSLYKIATIQRRVTRRMILTRNETLESYANFLRANVQELDALYSDVLIGVTSFFRNPEAFDALQREVLPELLKQRTNEPLRCWVLGCSTGQEAYSIAIACVEAAEKSRRMRRIQIFATDLNDRVLDKARQGLYDKTVANDVSPERLRRFFVEEEGGYRVAKNLRDMVVFARQNLINDPPFSRLDLISCRNLLIYLEPTLQNRALPAFHYGLNPGGYLMLGASESVGAFTHLFAPVDKKYKIYVKKPAPTPALHLPNRKDHAPQARRRRTTPSLETAHDRAPPPPGSWRGELNAQHEADRLTVSRFAPPSVLIDNEGHVLQFRGATGAYLEPHAGKASFDVVKMAREGLTVPLRAAINEAKKHRKTVRRANVSVRHNGEMRPVNLEVIPLKNLLKGYFLVLFEGAQASSRTASPRSVPRARPLTKKQEQSRIAALEKELSEAREYLQAMQEQHEAANEELQAANEEAQSANEEMQSVNEELETSKEELESSNEELNTLNEEINNRNTELTRLNSDLLNLQTSVKMPVVLLGRDLRIRHVSAEAGKRLGLLATDVGRPLSNIRHGLTFPKGAGHEEGPADLERMVSEVITTVREQEHEVKDREDRWHALRVRPYLTLDNKVDGAVLVLADIDALKQAGQIVTDARNYAENVIATVPEPLIVLDSRLRVEEANDAFYRIFQVTPGETIGRLIFELGNNQWDIPKLRELLLEILPERSTVDDFEVIHEFESIGKRTMLVSARQLRDPDERTQRILLAIQDVTERKQVAQEQRESEVRYRRLFESARAGIVILDGLTGKIIDANAFAVGMLGLEVPELLGKELHDVGLFRDVDEGKLAFQLLQRHGYMRYEDVPLRSTRGETIAVEVVSNMYEEDQRLVAQCNIRDISARVAMEKKIVLQAEAIANESRHKDEFLAMLSHELRNPLAPIVTATHLLKLNENANENPVRKRARETIERQTATLTRLVSDLLEVSRGIGGQMRLERLVTDMNEIVRLAIESTRSVIERRNHDLVLRLWDKPLWVDADPMRMEEVVINLVHNAAKYTADGGRIEVWCEQPDAHNHLQVRIRDNGIGIDEHLMPRIFELFTQADRSLARSEGGLGVGLSLAHRLVNLHGGVITAHSPPEGAAVGSEFIVRMPLVPAPELRATPYPEETEEEYVTGARVLVVDDNADHTDMLATALRHHGYSVQSAYTGPDGLQTALQWGPDIVLMDIGLPGLDGYEVARRIRSAPQQRSTRVRLIALTGYGRDADITLAREAGFDAHMVKPIKLDELRKLLSGPVD